MSIGALSRDQSESLLRPGAPPPNSIHSAPSSGCGVDVENGTAKLALGAAAVASLAVTTAGSSQPAPSCASCVDLSQPHVSDMVATGTYTREPCTQSDCRLQITRSKRHPMIMGMHVCHTACV